MKIIRFSKKELEVIFQAMAMSNGQFDDLLELPEHDVYKIYESALKKINVLIARSR